MFEGDVPADGNVTYRYQCPDAGNGNSVITGGYYLEPVSDISVISSRPESDYAWKVTLKNNANNGRHIKMTMYLMCAYY